MITLTLFQELKDTKNEKDIENLTRRHLTQTGLVEKIISLENTDGIVYGNGFLTLLEIKQGNDLTKAKELAPVILQTKYYLQNLEKNQNTKPSTIMICNENHIVYLHSNQLDKYFITPEYENLPPSTAYQTNKKLLKEIQADIAENKIDYETKQIFEEFQMSWIVEGLIETTKHNKIPKQKMTVNNMLSIFFEFFEDEHKRIITLSKNTHIINIKDDSKLPLENPENLLLELILNTDKTKLVDNYLIFDYEQSFTNYETNQHQTTKINAKVQVDSHRFDALMLRYGNVEYSSAEKEILIHEKDRMIPDQTRRRKGEFYTPLDIAMLSQQYMANQFGKDWNNDYTVWDCSCYDDITEVFTQRGWMLFKDLLDDDKIYSYNPHDGYCEWVGFSKRQTIYHKGTMYNFENHKVSLCVSENHKMYTEDLFQGGYLTSSQELFKKVSNQPIINNQNEALANTLIFRSIITGKPLKCRKHSFAFKKQPLEFAYFFGYALGIDALITNNKNKITSLSFTKQNCHDFASIKKTIKNIDEFETKKYEKGSVEFYIDDERVIKEFNKYIKITYDNDGHKQISHTEAIFKLDYEVKSHILFGLAKANRVDLLKNLQYERMMIECGYAFAVTPDKQYGTISSDFEDNFSVLQKQDIFTSEYDGFIYDITLEKNHVMLVKRNHRTAFCGNCGMANLTKNLKFKDLYQSTLNYHDIVVIKNEKINPEADFDENNEPRKFQFDFLNDDINLQATYEKTKMPRRLWEKLQTGKVLIYINPPFGTGVDSDRKQNTKEGMASETQIRELMNADKDIRKCAEQLYAQFLYRINLFNKINPNVKVGMFSKMSLLQQESMKTLREYHLKFQNGFIFPAGLFADTSDVWACLFSVWDNNHTNQNMVEIYDRIDKKYNFKLENLKMIGQKTIFHPSQKLTSWLDDERKERKTFKTFATTDGLKIIDGKDPSNRGSDCFNSIGYFLKVGNNIAKNADSIALFSPPTSMGSGFAFTKSDTDKVMQLFTARRTIDANWINDQDQYSIPSSEDYEKEYNTWLCDCYIYSLFDNQSYQSSINGSIKVNRCQIKRGKTREEDRAISVSKTLHYDYRNHFFFESKDKMRELAKIYHFDEMLLDLQKPLVKMIDEDDCNVNMFDSIDEFDYTVPFCDDCGGNTFVLQRINELLPFASVDAIACLNEMQRLIKESFYYRKAMFFSHPHLCLERWDCGYRQIKVVLKEKMEDEFKKFRNEMFLPLRKRLGENVYRYGFLKR